MEILFDLLLLACYNQTKLTILCTCLYIELIEDIEISILDLSLLWREMLLLYDFDLFAFTLVLFLTGFWLGAFELFLSSFLFTTAVFFSFISFSLSISFFWDFIFLSLFSSSSFSSISSTLAEINLINLPLGTLGFWDFWLIDWLLSAFLLNCDDEPSEFLLDLPRNKYFSYYWQDHFDVEIGPYTQNYSQFRRTQSASLTSWTQDYWARNHFGVSRKSYLK